MDAGIHHLHIPWLIILIDTLGYRTRSRSRKTTGFLWVRRPVGCCRCMFFKFGIFFKLLRADRLITGYFW